MRSEKEDSMTKLINILNKIIEVVMVDLIAAMVCGNL